MTKKLVKVSTKLRNFHLDESGPTVVEYAVMLGVIVLLSLKIIQVMGVSVADFYQFSADELNQARQ